MDEHIGEWFAMRIADHCDTLARDSQDFCFKARFCLSRAVYLAYADSSCEYIENVIEEAFSYCKLYTQIKKLESR